MRKLAIFSCAFALGAALYVWLLPAKAAMISALTLIAGMLLLMCLRSDAAIRMRIAAAAVAMGLLWSYAYEQLQIQPLRQLCGENVLVHTVISDYPQRTEYGCRVETRIEGGTMLLYLDEDANLKPGDQVTLYAQVIDVSRGSGDDQNLYYQSKDISLLAFQNEDAQISRCKAIPLRYLPAHWAQELRQHITKLFPSDAEGFMRALLLGDTSGIDYKVRNQMSITGLAHVFSVSGMHVSLLVGFFMLLMRRKRLAAGCAICAMFVFAALLGFAPSVSRAVIMNTILLLAPILKRENDPFTSLSFALLVILLGNPWAIASLSLQLSFLSMAGIFLFSAKIHRRFTERLQSLRCQRLVHAASLSVATSLGATSLTLPLTAYCFGMISLIAPIGNLLLLYAISIVFVLGFATLLLGIIAPLGALAAWCLAWPIRGIVLVVGWLSKVPYAAVYTSSKYVVAWLIFAYVMMAVCLLLKRERKLRHLLCALIATMLCAIGFSILDVPKCSFTMFNVGQGQSTLMQCGDFTVMVDCGGDYGDENGEYAARKLLMRGQRQLDALILTHYDDDHTCGVEQLLSRIAVDCIYLPDITDDSGRRAEIEQAASSAGVRIWYVTQDLMLQSDGATVKIFSPLSDGTDNEGICALMSLEECDILITGDMSIQAEQALLQKYSLAEIEVLVAGHHGSKHSTSPALLRTIRPETVLISVGKNAYGHPDAEVLERIALVGATVYRTDQNGDITITR